ncbi:MAG: Arc family DNA-binding protein [Kiloniellales bacterium]|nr:Arc family DNA-binding protein [Kiloniellales bacterium]
MAVQRKSKQRAQVGLRLPEDLRKRVEKAAKGQGVSMNAEIVSRLERSFMQDEETARAFGPDHTQQFLKLLAGCANVVEGVTGKPWMGPGGDQDTYRQVLIAWFGVLGAFGDVFTERLREEALRDLAAPGIQTAITTFRIAGMSDDQIKDQLFGRPLGKATLIRGKKPKSEEEST